MKRYIPLGAREINLTLIENKIDWETHIIIYNKNSKEVSIENHKERNSSNMF